MALFEPPSNLPIGKEPEDIFAGSSPSPSGPPRPAGGPLRPPSPPRPLAPGVPPTAVRPSVPGLPAPTSAASIAETPARGLGRKVGRLIGVVLILAVVGGGGYVAYVFFIAPRLTPAAVPEINLNVNVPPAPIAPEPPPVEPPPTAPEPVPEPPQPSESPADSDADGLTDAEETQMYDTNPLSRDTDADGLSDREEVITWKTDPNNPDSDGDGFNDGQEVSNGFNPLGPGKLLPPVNGS